MFDSSKGKNLKREFLTVVGIKTLPSRIRRHTYWQIYGDISEIGASFTFRVEQEAIRKKTGHEIRTKGRHSHPHITLFPAVSFLSEDGGMASLRNMVNLFCDGHCLLYPHLSYLGFASGMFLL
jgi:hypothetical protein